MTVAKNQELDVIFLQRYAQAPLYLPEISAPAGHDKTQAIALEIPSFKHPGFTTLVRYAADERCEFKQMHRWWLYVATPAGLTNYPALAELLVAAPDTGLHETLKRLEALRLLVFVAFCENSEEVFFGRSLDGYGSLFFAGQATNLVLADSSFEVATQVGRVTPSRMDEKVWLARSALDPEGSFLEGVKRCFAGVVYRSECSEKTEPARRLMTTEGDILSEVESVSLLHEGLMAMFASYGNRRVALRLSGGVDSRVLLVALLEAVRQGVLRKDQILCVSNLFPGLDCDESSVIRQIVQLAGLEWIGIAAQNDDVEEAYSQSLTLPSPPYPSSFLGNLCVAEASRRGAQLIISGHGGDEIFNYDLMDVLNGSLVERIRRTKIIRMLRNPHGFVAEGKALLTVCLGRAVMFAANKTLRPYGLTPQPSQVHRLGRRITLAQGCGYEMAACSSVNANLTIDAPFLRGPFFTRFDPAVLALESDEPFKPVALAFIEKYSPKIAEIATTKVSFEAAVKARLSLSTPKCDELDVCSVRSYAARLAYREWLRVQVSKGLKPNESNN